jgi:type III pantothenate kinase
VLLAVDVGNTQTHFGTFDGDELIEHWRFATVRDSTADELGAALRNLVELRGVGLADLRASIVSSTVPQLAPEWEEMGRRYLAHEMLVVGPGLKTGMPIRIDNPRELGADRLVNAIAAYDRFGEACVSVDFGTGINIDVVSAEGEYLGGAIGPGLAPSLSALIERAARITRMDLEEPKEAIGRSTRAAINSGFIFGFAGLIDGIVRRIEEELPSPRVLATGGYASAVVPFTETIDEVDDLLTLKGLRLIHERNR